MKVLLLKCSTEKEDTYYHSNWSGVAPMPHWIQITLPKESTAVSIGYQVRHNNNNGAPLQYTLLGSLNGTDFSKITTVTENLPTATKSKIYIADIRRQTI